MPPGTLRLAPGMPAAVMVRGILTFAFFGTDAYVSLTFQDVRDQPTWVAGVALTGATLGWTAAAWIQQRWILTAGPRRVVATGFAFLAVGIAGMIGAVGDLPIPVCIAAWSMAGFGIGLAYSPLAVTVLGLAEPGTEGTASSSIQLADVLGVALGAGLGGAFVALGESQGWATSTALGHRLPDHPDRRRDRDLRRPPPPHRAPRLTPPPPTRVRSASLLSRFAPEFDTWDELELRGRDARQSGEVVLDDVDEALAGLDGAEVLALHRDAGAEERGAAAASHVHVGRAAVMARVS